MERGEEVGWTGGSCQVWRLRGLRRGTVIVNPNICNLSSSLFTFPHKRVIISQCNFSCALDHRMVLWLLLNHFASWSVENEDRHACTCASHLPLLSYSRMYIKPIGVFPLLSLSQNIGGSCLTDAMAKRNATLERLCDRNCPTFGSFCFLFK